MFHRIKMLALAAATLALLFIGSTAMAAPGWRGGGIGIGIGRGYGGYGGYRGGYIGGGVGVGRSYGGYRGYYPGSYRSYGLYGYPGGYYGGAGYYGGYGNYGYGYGSPYYGSSYYSSGPVVYSSPSMVYDSPSRVVVAKPAIPNTVASTGTIKLRLPAGADGSVNYQLNGTAFTMNPGFSQKFANDRSWSITFDDGTGRKESYSLTAGNYEFVRAADGRWELRSF